MLSTKEGNKEKPQQGFLLGLIPRKPVDTGLVRPQQATGRLLPVVPLMLSFVGSTRVPIDCLLKHVRGWTNTLAIHFSKSKCAKNTRGISSSIAVEKALLALLVVLCTRLAQSERSRYSVHQTG